MRTTSIEEAKQRLNIHDLWRYFNYPGEPRTSCKSPFREDRRASFSVSADGQLWNDFATGDAGDVVDFLQRATGLSRKESCRKFVELAGGHKLPATRKGPAPRWDARRSKPAFPALGVGTLADLQRLALSRGLSIEGLQLAREQGLLRFAQLRGFDSWLVTDSQRLNAQARRLDGGLWEHIGAVKAYTLPGSWASWPIGAMEAQPFHAIAFCEGGPDLLAAFHFIHCENREEDCAAVAMLGSTQRIHETALPHFNGKHIRIFGHDDANGRRGVENWARQLEGAGATVDAFSFLGLRKVDGSPINDLNDCTSVCADDFEANRELWGLMP